MNLFMKRLPAGLIFAVFIFGIAVSSAGARALEPKTDTTNAKGIIRQVESVYNACKSYSDSGIVKTVFFKKDSKRISEKPFTTAFVRPNQFRFEYSSKFPMPGAKLNRYIIWCNGDNVRTWWDVQPGVEQEPSLGMAIAAATGVSSGSALTIPRLLMPEVVEACSVTNLLQPNRIEDAVLDGVDCYRIQGRRKKDSDVKTLWISKKTYLIHRIDESHKFTDFRTETTTTYKPDINNVIDENKLAFNAPEEGSNKRITGSTAN
jgi:outer membrane lipoprotein-sorting protein